jgi:signal transduction histidine kinase
MKRRANRLGGDFKINTGDREGTVLELRIPLKS